MKEILRNLKAGGDVTIGTRATIYTMSDGTLCIRMNTSLTGPMVKPNLTGLRTLLRWLDEQHEQSTT